MKYLILSGLLFATAPSFALNMTSEMVDSQRKHCESQGMDFIDGEFMFCQTRNALLLDAQERCGENSETDKEYYACAENARKQLGE